MATPEHELDYLNEERLREERLWQEGLTRAQVAAQIKKDEDAASRERMTQKVIAYRVKYNNWMASDITVRALIAMAESVGREA